MSDLSSHGRQGVLWSRKQNKLFSTNFESTKQREKSTENVYFQSFLHFIISFHIHNRDKNELNKIPYLNFEDEIGNRHFIFLGLHVSELSIDNIIFI